MCCCTKLQNVFRTTLISANITAFIDRYRAIAVRKTCLKPEELRYGICTSVDRGCKLQVEMNRCFQTMLYLVTMVPFTGYYA